VIHRALELRRERPGAVEEHRRKLEADVRQLQADIARYAEAVKRAPDLEELLEAMRTSKRRLRDAQAHLEHLDGLARGGATSGDDRVELVKRIAEWDAALGRHPVQVRQILRKLIDGRVRLTPREGEPGRFDCVFLATYGRLFAGIAGVQAMVPPG